MNYPEASLGVLRPRPIKIKNSLPFIFLISQSDEPLITLVSLIEPIVVFIRNDLYPFFDAKDMLKLFDLSQLVLTTQIISNIVVVDFARLFLLSFHEEKK